MDLKAALISLRTESCIQKSREILEALQKLPYPKPKRPWPLKITDFLRIDTGEEPTVNVYMVTDELHRLEIWADNVGAMSALGNNGLSLEEFLTEFGKPTVARIMLEFLNDLEKELDGILEFATGKRNNRVSVTTHYEELDDGTLVDKEKLKIAEINEWFEKAQDTIECLESLLPHERSGASATSE